MRTNIYLLSCLILGLFMASCQNGLEEVIDESAVQDELATTRAEDIVDNRSIDEQDLNEIIESLAPTYSTLSILGPGVVGGSDTIHYSITIPFGKTPTWSYNTSIFTMTTNSTNSDKYFLLNYPNSTLNTSIIVYMRDVVDNSLYSYGVKDVGLNGPHPNDCSLRVVSSSTGIEVYPSGGNVEPNSYYYAYFTTTTGGINMNLNWNIDNATILSNNGYNVYFKTDNTGSCYITISGSMPTYGFTKGLVDVHLF